MTDYRSCPFHGRPCTPKCAIFVGSEAGGTVDGRCGLIRASADALANKETVPNSKEVDR